MQHNPADQRQLGWGRDERHDLAEFDHWVHVGEAEGRRHIDPQSPFVRRALARELPAADTTGHVLRGVAL